MNKNSTNVDRQLEYFLFNTFMPKSSDIVMITDGGTSFIDARILGVNPSFEWITGLQQKYMINSLCAQWLNAPVAQLDSLTAAFKSRSAVRQRISIKNIQNDPVHIQFEIYPVQQGTKFWIWQAELVKKKQSIEHDQHLNQQLNQQDMMRVIEKIAGQTAHDFNNILAIVMGNNDLLLENIDTSSHSYPLLQSISRAVDKGTHLTQGLMAFAQKSTSSNKELNLNDCLSSMTNELQTKIGLSLVLKIVLCKQPCNICVEQTMLQGAIRNLVFNAAQAMSQKLTAKPTVELTIKPTIVIEIHKMFIPQQKDIFEQLIESKKYVKLTVIDTGTGITTANLPLIFTPFFTTQKTKSIKSTKGLGLSMVYGFLKRSTGYCLIDTEVGKGSSFSLLFNVSPHESIT
jgi:signal transduction histidine kinase